jgi:hypothetical protein
MKELAKNKGYSIAGDKIDKIDKLIDKNLLKDN